MTRERKAIRRVAERLLAGDTLAAQVAYLNEHGFTTYAGGPWTSVSLRTSLRRPALAGIAEHRGEAVGTLPGEPVLTRGPRPSPVLPRLAQAGPRAVGCLPAVGLAGLWSLREADDRSAPGKPVALPAPDQARPELGTVAREYWCMKRTGHVDTGCGRLNVDMRFADEVVTEAVWTGSRTLPRRTRWPSMTRRWHGPEPN